MKPVIVGDVTSRRQLLSGIEIFHIYHSHQYIVFFLSIVVQLLHIVTLLNLRIDIKKKKSKKKKKQTINTTKTNKNKNTQEKTKKRYNTHGLALSVIYLI